MADSVLDLSRLERRVGVLAEETAELNERVSSIDPKLDQIQEDLAQLGENLEQLRADFDAMVKEQRKAAALQEAATELVRVRQEIDTNFGNYRIVRETMLGVLQATDLALVKKTTISRVSEEIMLSTPEYWLAPCLVAVAAWIGNDRDLANRAIAEAVRRDKEKTALTMALICRRNNRVDTCHEWLSVYFDQQDSAEFSEGSFTYIDAYINGVFGPDKKHICDDYIAKWMNEIRGSNSKVESTQKETWKNYCAQFTIDVDSLFPDMKNCVPEYGRIEAYVGRLSAIDSIRKNFSGINDAYVDTDRLKSKIDKNLIQLISRYDAREEPLRKEEAFLLAVRALDGDKDAAKTAVLRREKIRQQQALNLVDQMTNVITTNNDVSPSERKTAVRFLSGYIRKGFNSYITENKDAFPKEITIEVENWQGVTADGNNVDALCADFEQHMISDMNGKREALNYSKPQMYTVMAVVCALLGVISFFAISPVAGVLLIVLAVYFGLSINKVKASLVTDEAEIQKLYQSKIETGKQQIVKTAEQWKQAKQLAETYENSSEIEIIA